MAYSDNLMAMDPSWIFRNTFPDTWLPDTFSRETDTLAKALQKTLDTQYLENTNYSAEFMSPWLNTSETTAVSVQTPTVSGGSAETENTSKKSRTRIAGGGKITKRKSRASKRATTTFINADAANFRQLVQEITGVKFGGGNGVASCSGQLVKPEARRGFNKVEVVGGGGGVPTLDTSAFLLDPTYQNNHVPLPLAVVSDGGGSASTSTSQFDYDSFCNFPTLESWKSY